MANSITRAEKWQAILDEVYKVASVTALMDTTSKPINFAGSNVVNIYKTSIVGMGTYSRATGFPDGNVTGTWETLTLATERGRRLFMDVMDDEETLGMAYGTLVGEFMRTAVIPELDAYRFSKYSSWSGIEEVNTPTTLTSGTVLAAFDTAMTFQDEAEVPADGRVLYVSSTVKKMFDQAVTRILKNEGTADRRLSSLDGVTIKPVPQTRFYKGITLDAGATASAGGYTKTTSTGRDINFMLFHPSALVQVAKHEKLRIFDPDVNQDKDGWQIDYRIYHDAFVQENKVDGVYSHIKAS